MNARIDFGIRDMRFEVVGMEGSPGGEARSRRFYLGGVDRDDAADKTADDLGW